MDIPVMKNKIWWRTVKQQHGSNSERIWARVHTQVWPMDVCYGLHWYSKRLITLSCI